MSSQIARELGYDVCQHTNGSWGVPGTSKVWFAKPLSYPPSVWPAKQFRTEAEALRFVLEETAGKLGITVSELEAHLARLRPTA